MENRNTFDIDRRNAQAVHVSAAEALARTPAPELCVACGHAVTSHWIIENDPVEGAIDVPAVCPCGCTAEIEKGGDF